MRDKDGKLLTEGEDYTIKYSNNVAANVYDAEAQSWTNGKKKPTVTVTGKGNYTGSIQTYFSIHAIDLGKNAEWVEIAPIYVKENGKNQYVNPVVKFDGKTLKKNSDYTVEWLGKEDKNKFKEPGTYTIRIQGKGNYSGTVDTAEVIVEKSCLLLSETKIKIEDAEYTGSPILPEVTVETKEGGILSSKRTTKENLQKDMTMIKPTEYFQYLYYFEDNTEVGTARVVLIGMPNRGVSGIVTKTFQIKGRKLAASNIEFDTDSKMYEPFYSNPRADKDSFFPEETLTWPGVEEPLVRGRDYEIEYPIDSYKIGTVKLKFVGKGNYTGTASKSFKVTPFIVEDKEESRVSVWTPKSKGYTGEAIKFSVVPECRLPGYGNSVYLKAGTDYTIKFSNNKEVYPDSDRPNKKVPTIKITFKGKYKGEITRTFEILPCDISRTRVDLKNVIYNTKVGGFRPKFDVVNTETQKKIKLNKDYTVAYYWGQFFNAEDVIRSGAVPLDPSKDRLKESDKNRRITLLITGKGSYTGARTEECYVATVSLHNVKISMAPGVKKYYTGEKVELEPGELILKDGKKKLVYGVDYRFKQFKQNTQAGNRAVVYIQGIGDYGGEYVLYYYTIHQKKISIKDVILKKKS